MGAAALKLYAGAPTHLAAGRLMANSTVWLRPQTVALKGKLFDHISVARSRKLLEVMVPTSKLFHLVPSYLCREVCTYNEQHLPYDIVKSSKIFFRLRDFVKK